MIRTILYETDSERIEHGGEELVQRWQALTGRAAVLDGDGRSFAAVAEARGTSVQTAGGRDNVPAE